jgi:SAM-dependent methyltransferase
LNEKPKSSAFSSPEALSAMRNPHFDEDRLVWRDEYSGQYDPPAYDEQFDLQWKIALEGNAEYYANPGASVDDSYIEDRVYEWTGKHPTREKGFYDASMGIRVLDNPIDPALINGKQCIDIGCGMGRWTRTLQRLGAKEVLSVDISESALKSTVRFNKNILRANIMNLPKEHPELKEKFDFGNFWGVAMCTHDPKMAFESAAFTIKPGGALYLMVYATEGIHNTKLCNIQRRKFYHLKSVEERLAYVDAAYDRKWDWDYPLIDNILNVTRNLCRLPKGSKVGFLDMLEPFYNWTIPLNVIEGWIKSNGFSRMVVLNEGEKGRMRCAHHVLCIK